MARLIVITSGKGGVGKTTTAINLGASLNSFGKNALVLDANLTTPNVGVHLGAPVVSVNLHHVLAGKKRIAQAIYKHYSGMKVVPASISLDDLRDAKPEKLGRVARQLKKKHDIVICDSAAGLGKEAATAIGIADELVVVTNPELPAVTDALKVIKLAEDMGKNIAGVVVARTGKHKRELSLKDIEVMLERPIIGEIPEDIAEKESIMERDAVVHTHPKSKAALSYKRLAAN
ncbi:unnamed protein product [marine sediment metagenome]|uniref:AAA domain-containing protein n=1 Tax=marine sediment metagenome TaxID=412755 RepID=X1MIX8_9ZZZZ